jgi:GR25 family glycosyltransferase involved in LPS biosynthesis
MYARIINLDSRPDRWKRLSSLGIERFPAIVAKSPQVSLRTLATFSNRRSHEALSGLGAVGCALSHIQVWKDFLETDKELCAVFEDDITLFDTAAYMHAARTMPGDVRLLGWLGHIHPVWGNYDQKQSCVIPWPASCGFMGAHAYVLTRHAAKCLVGTALPLEMQVDYYLQAVAWRDGLRVTTTSLPPLKQVWTGGGNVFTICFMCEPLYPIATGIIITFLLMALVYIINK